jgi:hypothetical protein
MNQESIFARYHVNRNQQDSHLLHQPSLGLETKTSNFFDSHELNNTLNYF